MSGEYLQLMWQGAEVWRLGLAVFSGIVVSIIYFECLRWSIEHLFIEHKRYGLFGLLALLRIALFFTVLILIANRNVAVVTLYILAFFITKTVIVWVEKRKHFAKKDG